MSRPNAGLLDHARRLWVPLLVTFALSGCTTVSYYSQLAVGQMSLLSKREPVEALIRDPATSEAMKARLALSQRARTFATEHLGLPDNHSYRVYADIGRPYVVWSLFATDAFSLDPITHCFPIAGCVAYRGFYDQNRARGAAALLSQEGKDTYVAGIQAYSTLGWFDDPLLSSMMHWSDDRLVALIFHELAHQQLYVPGDTAFNESFATFVEQEGLRQWRATQGLPAADHGSANQRKQFVALVLKTRSTLAQLYREPLPAAQMRARKRAAFEQMRAQYRVMRDNEWHGDARYDAWIEGPMNNAKLLPFGLYDQWVPAFEHLYREHANQWPAFYDAVRALGNAPAQIRQKKLQSLADHIRN